MATVHAGIEQQLRSLGPVLDMPATRALYESLLTRQPRAGVNVSRDLHYGPDPRHRLDLYRLAGAPGGAPIVLMFPGGGFIRGDKSERANAGYLFARAGYVTVVANYRLAPAHQWPAGAQDVARAVEWVHSQADHIGVSIRQLWLVGESAGATHVATATLWKQFRPTSQPGIAGAVLISGAYNPHLEWHARPQFGIATPDPRNEAYFGTDATRYASMSLVSHIDVEPLPLLITFAEMDLLQMQVQASELFGRLVVQHGFAPALRMIRGHNHLSQVFSFNTGDDSLSAPILDFLSSNAR